MARSLLPILLALSACAPAAEEHREREQSRPVASTDPPHELPALLEARHLFGQWQLVSLTGASLAENPPIHLLIGHEQMEAMSQCVPFALSISFLEGVATVTPRQWPGPVCARGLSPAEEAFPIVMAAARKAERRPGGRVAFVGPRGEAVIERPAEMPANPFGNAPGPDPWLMWGEWQVRTAGGKEVGREPMRLLFLANEVEAQSGCVAMAWRYEYGGHGALRLKRSDAARTTCERMESPAERALAAIFDGGEVRIVNKAPGERLLIGKAGTVHLAR